MDLSILGKSVAVRHEGDVSTGDWEMISERLSGFPPALDQATSLTADQRSILLRTDGIVIFRSISFKNQRLTRSFMDLENRLFHWHAGELLDAGYRPANRVATYYFHDAFHVHQYLAGDRATDLDSLVNREVEATRAQLELAIAVRTDVAFQNFLSRYMSNRTEIEARLRTGVGFIESFLFGRPRYVDHLPVIE